MKWSYLTGLLLLSVGLVSCPTAGIPSENLQTENLVRVKSEDVEETQDSVQVSPAPSLQTQALTPPPAKAPSSELEDWWREAEPGTIRPEDVQQRIPTENLIDWLVRAYEGGGSPDLVQSALQSARWQASRDDFQQADIDGDGTDEWLVTVYFFDPDFMPWGTPGDFWIIGETGLSYRFFTPDRYFDDDYEAQPEFFLSAPGVVAASDLTGEGNADPILSRTLCGAHTCTYFYSVLSQQGEAIANIVDSSDPSVPGTITMTYAEPLSLADETGDGLPDFRIYGGWVGSAGSGIQRPRTEIWAWNGAAIALADVRLDPTEYRYHLLWEANDEFDEGNVNRAIELYEQVVGDRTLLDAGSFNDEAIVYRDTRNFAAFRLLLAALVKNDPAQAMEWNTWLYGNDGNAHLTTASDILLDVSESASLKMACAEVTDYLLQFEVMQDEWITESPTGALRDMGYANPSLTADDVCPL